MVIWTFFTVINLFRQQYLSFSEEGKTPEKGKEGWWWKNMGEGPRVFPATRTPDDF
jgi:hypothetical protein